MTNIFGARMGQSHVNKLAPAQNRRPAAKCKKKPQKPGLGWVQRKDAQSHLMQFLYTMARTIRPWDAVDSLYMFILRVDSLYMKVYNMFTYVFLYFSTSQKWWLQDFHGMFGTGWLPEAQTDTMQLFLPLAARTRSASRSYSYSRSGSYSESEASSTTAGEVLSTFWTWENFVKIMVNIFMAFMDYDNP